MTSNESHYRVWGCLTPSPAEPNLQHHFDDRAAQLVKSLAEALLEAHDPQAADSPAPLTTPEGFEAFCRRHGMDAEQLRDGCYHLALEEALGSRGRKDDARGHGEDPGNRGRDRIVDYLIRDFKLLEQWIIARKGEAYLTILFGTCRTMPYFSDNRASIPVEHYLAELAADQAQSNLPLAPAPFEGLLVDDGPVLRVASKDVVQDPVRTGALLEHYRDFHLWVIVFSS